MDLAFRHQSKGKEVEAIISDADKIARFIKGEALAGSADQAAAAPDAPKPLTNREGEAVDTSLQGEVSQTAAGAAPGSNERPF